MPLSLLTIGSSNWRPISRLMAKKVLVGLVTAWRLGGLADEALAVVLDGHHGLGVVRAPSAFSTTLGALPSITATHEFVVPRSMPMILLIQSSSCGAADGPANCGLDRAPRLPVPSWM